MKSYRRSVVIVLALASSVLVWVPSTSSLASAAAAPPPNPMAATMPSAADLPEGQIAFVAAAHTDESAKKVKALDVPAAAQAGDTVLMFFTQNYGVTWTGPTGVTGWQTIHGSGGVTFSA